MFVQGFEKVAAGEISRSIKTLAKERNLPAGMVKEHRHNVADSLVKKLRRLRSGGFVDLREGVHVHTPVDSRSPDGYKGRLITRALLKRNGRPEEVKSVHINHYGKK